MQQLRDNRRRAQRVWVEGREVPLVALEPPRPAEYDEEPKPLGQEAPEIINDAARIGGKRLERTLAATGMTALIGGMSVSFGAVAMAWAAASMGGSLAEASPARLVGALAFPVGFVILLIGKSELFTENFFLPVTGVLAGRGSPQQLAYLWGVTLAANLLGAAVFAFLATRPGVLDAGPASELITLAAHKVDYLFWTAFTKAIFAGWLMTLLTWLLIAAQGLGPRLMIIWMVATVIVLGGFNHVVISASEIFMAMMLGAPISLGDWFVANFLPALVGNVIGGVVFVTLLHYVQAHTQQQTD